VFVCFIILGAVFLLNVNLVQSRAGEYLSTSSGGEKDVSFEEPKTMSSSSPSILAYIPMVSNRYKVLENHVIVANGQAFDKCTPPRVDQMQTWWDESPYSTINIYLGGISLACSYRETDPQWFTQVANQGWSFILTWAGPQAPPGCHTPNDFNHPMSIDPDLAYQEGRTEADAAVDAATAIGFKGELVIYYDIEGYEDEPDECRAAVASFIKGWTERLHELDVIAGAYGSPCRSYIADWAANDPPPDNVWIAHWYTNDYDPEATVWDDPVNIPCLSDDLWANSQRIKQYNGDHYETWGDLEIKIDSNVMDGQVNALLPDTPDQTSQLGLSNQSSPQILSSVSPTISAMDLLPSEAGWILADDRLRWTMDGGASWQELTPPSDGHYQILGVYFLDVNTGWMARRSASQDQKATLSILSTVDGGLTWQENSLPNLDQPSAFQVESASLDFVNSQTGWMALKLQSSSNFSFGRLFATQDGGRTWQERSLPLGEPVNFLDSYQGWTVGGPKGDQIFYTQDGGFTWNIPTLPPLESDTSTETVLGLPIFNDQKSGVLPMVLTDGEITNTYLFSTSDSGSSWTLSETIQLDQVAWKDLPATPELMAEGLILNGKLPQGATALDVITSQLGWALVQDGVCTGNKVKAGESLANGLEPFRCQTYSQLLKTTDGGISWHEITPLD
jgi:photosystem II stability/assembly factor-like uncharacterized protein